jgi:hypothetical protein
MYPTFYYKGGSVASGLIQGSRKIDLVPEGYDNSFNAVDAYLFVGAQTLATVNDIKITGIERKTVSTIYSVTPEFPSHIY